MKRLRSTGTAVLAAAAAALVVAPAAHADGAAPTGAVAGKQSPAEGTVTYHVTGRAGSAHLANAAVLYDGTQVDSDALCKAADPDCDLGDVDLTVDTTKFSEGNHHLVITVSDVAGNVGTVADETVEVNNIKPQYSPTATLTIGSDVPETPGANQNGGGSQGGVQGATADSCPSPKLSVLLSSKPVRITHRVPVLYRGKHYRFTGRLTCLVNHRRRSAAKNTVIHMHAFIGSKTAWKGRAKVGSGGKFAINLGNPTSRTIEFAYIAADGKYTRIRIKVQVVTKSKQKQQ